MDIGIKTKKSDAMKVLGPTLHGLLKLNPNNPVVRAQVLAACKVQPPPEAVTWEQVVEWIEYNIDPILVQINYHPATAIRRPVGIIAHVGLEEIEHGTATYSCRRYGESEVTVPDDELRALLSEADSWDEVMEGVIAYVNTHAWDDSDLDNCDDYEYEDYNSEDTDSSDNSVLRIQELRQTVKSRAIEIDNENFERIS